MEMKIIGCSGSEFETVKSIRRTVFTQEQGADADTELDAHDSEETTEYILLCENGAAVATGRLVPLPDGAYKIGRIAVLATQRGKGTGKALVQALCARAAEKGADTVLVDAQLHAVPFYEKLGFCPTGEKEITDRGIQHLPMVKKG